MRAPGRWVVVATLAFATMALALACVQRAVVEGLEGSDPAAALRWCPDCAQPLAWAADDTAQHAKTRADFGRAAGLARRALSSTPMQSRALRVLAWDAEDAGRAADARRLMELAGRLTQRDNRIHGWLFYDALDRHAYGAAMRSADAVLRRDQELGQQGLYSGINEHLAEPTARNAVVDTLAFRPGWRPDFLSYEARHVPDTGVLIALFGALHARSALSANEASWLVDRLVDEDRYAEARSVWTRLLPRRQAKPGLLYDAGFAGWPGAPPFNWRFVDGSEAISEIAEAPDGSRGLHVQFPLGRSERLVEQLVVLPAGTYRLAAQLSSETPAGGERLVWKVECVPESHAPLMALVHEARGPSWRPLGSDFTVPATACPAQRLSLWNLPGDGFGVAQAWYRGLVLAPEPT